ncbi:MAG: MBL fold metallo-hydrolase [Carbonactinosporaceae bacterium]
MRITVLGGCGAWPAAGQACSGYLVEHGGFRLLIDPGYATLPRLLEHTTAEEVDAVFVSHGHPDHCADLNPLLRARALQDRPPPPLPVFAQPGSVDAVLALDRPPMLAGAHVLHGFTAGSSFEIGPFRAETRLLPHFVPNAGVRLTARGRASDLVLTYTGDTGPSPEVVGLARRSDVLLAEATHVDEVPEPDARYLTSARQAGRQAADADVGWLVLTHLWPGTEPASARAAAREAFPGRIEIAKGGLVLDPECASGSP